MNLASPRVFWWVLLPALVLLLAAWRQVSVLGGREAALASEAAALRASLARDGFEDDADSLVARRDFARADAATLRHYAAPSFRLADDPLVRESAARPFTLIEFERERAAAAEGLRTRATAAQVSLAPSAFEVLTDTTEAPAQPRRRWAQLALAREVASRAVEARVATYEALPVPAVREVRAERGAPLVAEQILFSARVTGDSARVQAFVELLALGAAPESPRLLLEHLVLRKDGVAAPDQASAMVVVSTLLPPAPPPAP
jgi:hypothetical protein